MFFAPLGGRQVLNLRKIPRSHRRETWKSSMVHSTPEPIGNEEFQLS